MDKKYPFKELLETHIDRIDAATKKAKKLHRSGDIPASGIEVEGIVRRILSNFLPERYLVAHGHLVNSKGEVSPQLDVIIVDRLTTPKFLISENESLLLPVESALVVGEIKTTLYPKHLVEFAEKIEVIKQDMGRKLIENSAYGRISNNTDLKHAVLAHPGRKYLNSLYSFVFAVNVKDIDKMEDTNGAKHMPNSTMILNYGSIMYGHLERIEGTDHHTFKPSLEDEPPGYENFVIVQNSKHIVFGSLLEQIIGHLSRSYSEPMRLTQYILENPKDFEIKGDKVRQFTLKKT